MVYWSIFLLAADVILVSGILYYLIAKRPEQALAPDISLHTAYLSSNAGASFGTAVGHGDYKKLAMEIRDKQKDFEAYEKRLIERQKNLDRLLDRFEESVRSKPDVQNKEAMDVYARAVEMMRRGVPADEIMANLGISWGETELISGIARLRQGSTGEKCPSGI
ncbi:MAG: DUF2802 domain-containing protein [Deltaproteobacteria bacterium]|nr:DUF2802 domain-containing protein [Deltaproteobacteria bacterium]